MRFEMSCTIGNGMVLVSEMVVLLESASMGEGAWLLGSSGFCLRVRFGK